MKVEDFYWFNDKEVRVLRNLLMDCHFDETKIKTLSSKVSEFVLRENPQGGNVTSRINRCLSCIDRGIIKRFLNIKD